MVSRLGMGATMKIAAALFLGTLINIGAANAQESPLTGYQVMTFPRTSIALGAKWLQDTGPNGVGTETANIDTAKGLSNVQITTSMKRALNFSIGTFLGLSGDRARSLDSKYTNLSIDRVKDVTKVAGLRSGERILYEAVKAGKIEIKGAKGTNAALKAAAEARGIPVALAMSSGNNSVLTLDGSDLYIAYKVMEVGPATSSTQRSPFTNYSTAFETRLAPYRVSRKSFNDANFCAQSFPAEPAAFVVVNEAQPDITGNFPTKEIYVLARAPSQEFPLDVTQTNNRIFARRLRVSYYPTGYWTTSNGRNVCMIDYPNGSNFVELTTSQFDLRVFVNPKGL